MKRILLTLAIIISFNWIYSQVEINSFQQKIDSLIATLSTNYTESKERFVNGQYNDITLDGLTYSEWTEHRSFKGKKTMVNSYNQKVKQRLYLGFQQFKTIETCDKAFAELLNCLGTDCQSLKWNESNVPIKTTPFIYIKTDTQIVYCKINCEHHLDNWFTLKQTLLHFFNQKGAKIIEATCGSKVSFEVTL